MILIGSCTELQIKEGHSANIGYLQTNIQTDKKPQGRCLPETAPLISRRGKEISHVASGLVALENKTKNMLKAQNHF